MDHDASAPALSAVLATDRFETIDDVLRTFRAQTVACQLEVVVVAPDGSDLHLDDGWSAGFAGAQVVRVDSLVPLGAARAKGVRAARAPVVYLAETHAYPEPTTFEPLLSA